MAFPILLALAGHAGAAYLGNRASNRRQKTREQTALETNRRTAQVLGKMEGDALGSTIAGMGFQAGTPGLLDAAKAAALGDNSALAGLAAEQGIGMSPLDTSRMNQIDAATLAQQQGMAYASEMQPGAVELQQQRIQSEELRQQVFQKQLEDNAAQGGLLPEEVLGVNPFTGMPQNILIGGKDFREAQGTLDNLMGMIQSANDYMGLVGEYGSEQVGEVATRMNSIRSGLLIQANQARGGGAPQAAELEVMAAGMPDATSIGQNVRGFAQGLLPGGIGDVLRQNQEETINAGYSQLSLEASRSVLKMLEQNPALSVDLDKLDPRVFDRGDGTSPNDVKEYYRANSGVGAIAQ